VTVDDARRLSSDRHIGQNTDDETRADCNTVDRRNNRLVAINNVVDEVLGFLPSCHAGDWIVENALDQLKVSSCRKGFASPGNNHSIDFWIVIDVAPDIRKLGMGFGVDRVIRFRPIEGQPKNTFRG